VSRPSRRAEGGGRPERRSAVRVAIVDGEELFRAGLRAMLETQGLQVVGEARRAAETLSLVRRTAPDVVLLSLESPGTAGREATRRLKEVAPETSVVAVTDTLDQNEVIDALAAGASAYVARDDAIETILAGVVRAAAAGEPLLSARTTRALIDRLRQLSAERMRGEALRATLSPREVEVLRLVAEGQDNGDIARLLYISPHTVKHHVRTICDKLGAHNRIEAAVRAARAGIV
jgi:DNA-binding NarL/FixJ family response regulator